MKVILVDVEGIQEMIERCGVRMGGIYKVVREDKKFYCIESGNGVMKWMKKERFREVKEVEKYQRTTKTFKEVITDIKEGEVWKGDIVSIRKLNNYIDIEVKGGFKEGVSIRDDLKFELQRKKYSFYEVMKEYEKGGVVMESLISGKKIKCDRGEDYTLLGEQEIQGMVLTGKEIKGEWFINV